MNIEQEANIVAGLRVLVFGIMAITALIATVKPRKITDERVKLDKNAPAIALVIDDCGLDVVGTKGAIALPAAVTLTFLPYGIHSRSLAMAAQQAGHDTLLHMPMQPVGAADPGPNALVEGLTAADITARVKQGFAALPSGLVGLNNHMGSRFSANASGMAVVMTQLKQRGLFFLDSVTSSKTAGIAAARFAGVPVIARDVFLDDTVSEAEVTRQLARAETIARQRGSAIAIGHPHPQTLRALNRWITTAPQRGFRLVPLTTLVPKV